MPAGKTIIFAMKGGFLELIVEGDSLFVMSSLSSLGPHFFGLGCILHEIQYIGSVWLDVLGD